MKNFPHQINQLPKLNDALGVLVALIDGARDVDDDGVVGDALARARVYTFRKPRSRSIKTLLTAEHRKDRGSQGTRTCARDLRRFFRLLEFIARDEAGVWRIANTARTLLTLKRSTDEPRMHELWRQRLLDLALEDGGHISHPYRILLRLVAEVPDLPKPYSGLCLEASDDSAAEFARIRSIASQLNPTKTMHDLAGAHMARDSIKILPSLAEQLGDIVNVRGRLTISSRVADVLFDARPIDRPQDAVRNLARRPFVPRRRQVGGSRRRGAAHSGVSIRRYDPDLIGARFDAHEDCLDRFSRKFPRRLEQLQAVYDLLIVGRNKALLLVEAKTIRNDERSQVRIGLGQLYYYEHFDVAPLYPKHQTLRLLLTDRPVSADLCNFLSQCEVGVVWITDEGIVQGSKLGLNQVKHFGIRR
jgi:hypothetical protein